jgi:hypothetical protein
VGFARALVAHEALHDYVLKEILSYLQVLPRVEFNWRTEEQTKATKERDIEHTPAMSERAAELMADNRESLRTYEVERGEAREVLRTAPVSEPGPSISCMGDMAARIDANGLRHKKPSVFCTTPIKQEQSLLGGWIVARDKTPKVSLCMPEREARGVPGKNSRFLRLSI